MNEQDLPLRPSPGPSGSEPAPPDATPPPSSSRRLKVPLIIGAVALALGVWAVIALLPSLLNTPPGNPPGPAAADAGAADTRKVHVSLFYVSDSGLELTAVGRDIPYGATTSEQARRIIEAQIQAPSAGHVSAIPPETTVRAVYLGQKGDAYVDLGPEIVQHHSGGTIDEALTVYAIVNALATNLNDVRTVQILIDGKEVDTLAGHIDLRRPIAKSTAWIQKASPAGR